MKKLKSCGFIIFSPDSENFLLLKHADRFDLPKGHIEPHETELECALRELEEETNLKAAVITIDENFRFEISYTARYKRFNNESVGKTLVVFLGYLLTDAQVVLTEHQGYKWFEWKDRQSFQEPSIENLLKELAEYFQAR